MGTAWCGSTASTGRTILGGYSCLVDFSRVLRYTYRRSGCQEKQDGPKRTHAQVLGALQRAKGGTASYRIRLPGQRPNPTDRVWEGHVSLPRGSGEPPRPLPLLDAQGPREDGRADAHRRRTRTLPGMDRKQPQVGTGPAPNAQRVYSRSGHHDRQEGPVTSRVLGSPQHASPAAIALTAAGAD